MQINAKKLEAAGYTVDIDPKRGIVSIYATDPVRLDWSCMEDQWNDADIAPFAKDCGLDAFYMEVEMHQIMEICRG